MSSKKPVMQKTYDLTKLQVDFIAGALIEYQQKYDAYSFNPTLDGLVDMFYKDSKSKKHEFTQEEISAKSAREDK